MSLLRDIQDAAVDSRTSLPALLRRCKILAARLGNAEFKAWVDAELNGYASKDTVPQYRVMTVHSKGHFSGPFQSGMRNADIPLSCIPEKFREGLSEARFLEPIASLESLVESSKGGIAQEAWSPDLVAFVGRNIYQNMNCVQAWKVIPMNAIVAVLDTVRTRILNFVLEIEGEAPDAGEAPVHTPPVPQEKVTQIFNTHIVGNVGNIAAGSADASQEAHLKPDIERLYTEVLEAVSRSNLDSDAISRLSTAVEEMRDAGAPERFSDAYRNFMSLFADHVQVLGPVLAPYLPALSKLLP